MTENYDCVIIGAGPAALEAGLFLGRAKIRTLILGDHKKSDLASGRLVGNLFGIAGEPSGLTLLENSIRELKKYSVEVRNEEVIDLMPRQSEKFMTVTAADKTYASDSVIIATGAAHVKAGIKGEDNYFGKGVHTCVACDGPIYSRKAVGVIGAGSHAAAEALEVSDYAAETIIFTQGHDPEWAANLGTLIREKNIKVNAGKTRLIKGTKMIEGLVMADGSEIKIDGIFVAKGSASSVTFAYKTGLVMKNNFIKIDRDGKTSVAGIWAAGGCTGGNAQIAKSIGEGCNAAVSIIKTLKKIETYSDQT